MTLWQGVAAAIAKATQRPCAVRHAVPVGGGDINQSYRLHCADDRIYFVKLNDARRASMFAAEAAGLEVLAAAQSIRVPQVITHGVSGQQGFLVLEYLDLSGRGKARLLGEQLAALHRSTAKHYGFAQDNFIGSTPQPNGWKTDWVEFWREQRLAYLLRLAEQRQLGTRLQNWGARLLEVLPDFFGGYTPFPSLLHGDLWGGNHGYLPDGMPVIFDPACYYGDRECDLAMTELFGGYGEDFYAAYRAHWPLDAGYAQRRELYNLYHILNHALLFEGSYVRQAENMTQRLLAARN